MVHWTYCTVTKTNQRFSKCETKGSLDECSPDLERVSILSTRSVASVDFGEQDWSDDQEDNTG